ncbi:6074_t:CDS:2, partial [Ambispora gerdemannii]
MPRILDRNHEIKCWNECAFFDARLTSDIITNRYFDSTTVTPVVTTQTPDTETQVIGVTIGVGGPTITSPSQNAGDLISSAERNDDLTTLSNVMILGYLKGIMVILVRVHGISNDIIIHESLLDLKLVFYPHIGANIAALLQESIQEWNFEEKTIVIATDNASSMVKALLLMP